MIANRNFGQYEPLGWIGRLPIYLSTALAIAHAACLVISALGMTIGLSGFFGQLLFSTASAVGSFHLWEYFTYAFVYTNPGAYLGVVIQIYMLAAFGQQVEQFIGRKQFAFLYVALVVAVPIFLTILSLCKVPTPFLLGGEGCTASFAVFLAFVLIYPRVQIFFGIEARWIGLVLVSVYSLMMMASHDWIGLGMFWTECSVALFWMAKEGVQGMSLPSLPSFKSFAARKHSQKHLKVVRRELEDSKDDEEYSLHDSIDPILDKIAKEGIASLTRGEREKLERARVALLEKEGRR